MNKKHLILLVLFIISIKIIYLTISVSVKGSHDNILIDYVTAVKQNDSYWYQNIYDVGYPEITNKEDLGYARGVEYKQSSWAFFPFYPYLIKITTYLFGANFNLSAFIFSLLFSVMAIIGMYLFSKIYFSDEKKAFFATLLFFSFPFSFYFSMFYTEALFFTFLIFSFISIHFQKYVILSLLLIPLVLLRPNGVILLLPLYLYFLEQKGILNNLKIKWKSIFSKEIIYQSLAFTTGPIFFGIYCVYQYSMTGYFFAFSIAQKGWYREFMFPILSFFRNSSFNDQFHSFFTIIVIVFAFFNRKKLPVSLNIFLLVSLLLPLCSGSVLSMSRFVSIMFPLFFMLSIFIYKLKFKYGYILLFLFLHAITYRAWIIDLIN